MAFDCVRAVTLQQAFICTIGMIAIGVIWSKVLEQASKWTLIGDYFVHYLNVKNDLSSSAFKLT